MSRIIKVDDDINVPSYLMPKAFFYNPLYKGMGNDTKVAYAILRELAINSNSNCIEMSRKKLMQYLDIKGAAKIAKVFKELRENNLIAEERIGLTKCNKIYVYNVKETEE